MRHLHLLEHRRAIVGDQHLAVRLFHLFGTRRVFRSTRVPFGSITPATHPFVSSRLLCSSIGPSSARKARARSCSPSCPCHVVPSWSARRLRPTWPPRGCPIARPSCGCRCGRILPPFLRPSLQAWRCDVHETCSATMRNSDPHHPTKRSGSRRPDPTPPNQHPPTRKLRVERTPRRATAISGAVNRGRGAFAAEEWTTKGGKPLRQMAVGRGGVGGGPRPRNEKGRKTEMEATQKRTWKSEEAMPEGKEKLEKEVRRLARWTRRSKGGIHGGC